MIILLTIVPDEEDKKKALSQYPPDFNYETGTLLPDFMNHVF